MTKKIYLAGPDVFLPNAVEIGQRKKDICAKYGLVGLYPFDNEVTGETKQQVALDIFINNIKMMDDCDGAIINLTPFRGASADVGTVFELGYLTGKKKSLISYTNTNSNYLDRIGDKFHDGKKWIDRQGLTIEDFSIFDNLMLWGASIPYVKAQEPWLDWNNLTMFERAVEYMSLMLDDELDFIDFANKINVDIDVGV